MNMSLTEDELVDYVACQLVMYFPDNHIVEQKILSKNLPETIARLKKCFSAIHNKYFEAGFDHLHGDQYAMFLWFASNTLWRNEEDPTIYKKLFLLNKYLHAIDVLWEIELPDIFLFAHPVGTVLGRAKYSNYFAVYQNCNVGVNHNVFPTFDEYVSIHPGGAVLGDSHVGRNCKISVGSILIDRDLEANHVWLGNSSQPVARRSDKVLPIWREE